MTLTDQAHNVQDLQELIKQMVELREEIKLVEVNKQRAQEVMNACSTQLLGLKSQMKEARKLLDHCLETGEDVTAVRLTKTMSELKRRNVSWPDTESVNTWPDMESVNKNKYEKKPV